MTLAYGVYLWLAEKHYRQALSSASVSAPAPAPVSTRPAAADPTALITVLGLQTPQALKHSSDPAVLRGIFVATTGESRALLAIAGSQRSYGVGERLPSGSVLRRIEVDRVLLWRNGREEVLPLAGSAQHLRNATALPAPSIHRHLRPRVATEK